MMRRRFKLTDLIAIGISCAAFILSASTSYFSLLRVSDDVRLVISGMPQMNLDWKQRTFEIERPQKFLFINAGTRAVSINSIYLKVAQPKAENEAFEKDCKKGEVEFVYYDSDPFVVRAGEMLTKQTNLL
jgi:hypothetical protein